MAPLRTRTANVDALRHGRPQRGDPEEIPSEEEQTEHPVWPRPLLRGRKASPDPHTGRPNPRRTATHRRPMGRPPWLALLALPATSRQTIHVTYPDHPCYSFRRFAYSQPGEY